MSASVARPIGRPRVLEVATPVCRNLQCTAETNATPDYELVSMRNMPVLVKHDVSEVARLCEEPSPGATESVNWDPLMAPYCGSVGIIDDVDAELRSVHVRFKDQSVWSFPFPTLQLMLYQ